MNAPIGKKFLIGKALSTEALQIANYCIDKHNQDMATRIYSKPRDFNDAALLALTHQVLEGHCPGLWQLRPTENYGVCLVSSNWNDA
jgi:hypothetical protein